MNLIARKEYPALDYILWDTAAEQIPAERAFHLYEKRWKYIDAQQLTGKERNLIDRLTQIIGHGLFLAA
ncbi:MULTISPECIES: hypothetical protein [Acinetobacter]|jgi:hypothetical protein|uniref:hypothetical protein n=1 Tax=Acinetobacter TaxID=469 RepID=UPI00257BF5E5|nr:MULTISPECIES: hypothetical protein [Acinetobacter]